MGLITGILTAPLAPVRGVAWVAEQVHEQAMREFYDPEAIQLALDQVQLDRELGVIDEEEADRREDELLERLIEASRGGGRHG
ncbi:MAG: gas vesicle protein GvpG [Nocardioides sp.]